MNMWYLLMVYSRGGNCNKQNGCQKIKMADLAVIVIRHVGQWI